MKMTAFGIGLVVAALSVSIASVMAQGTQAARHIPASEATAIIEKALASKQTQLAAGKNYNLMVLRRTGVSEAEFHQKRTHVFFIQDGEATFVTGGEMVEMRETGPGERRSKSVSNGTTVTLHKGDVVVVPPATIHWFKEAPTQVTYYSVNIDEP